MRQIVVPWTGGIPGYGDARPDGRYVVSVPALHVVTDQGTVPKPEGHAARFVTLPHFGNGFACTWSDGGPDRAKEWMGDHWEDRGLSCGTNAVIYDLADELHVSRCEPPQGSQGWRYVDATGQLVTCDETYADVAKGLFEWTAWPDVRIGQGNDGAVVWFPDLGSRRLSFDKLREAGNLRNIRARRAGNDFAITVVDYDQHLTTVTWATLAELRAMPAVVPTSAPVTIPPFTFPTAVVWFFEDSERPSVTPSPAPGQWSLIVESGLNPPKPVIIGRSGDLGEDLIAEWAGRWSQVRGIYVADEASRAGLQRQARMAVASMKARGLAHRPVYSYSAENLWTDIPEIDVIGVQLYPEPGETAAQSEARWKTALSKAAGKRVALVCGLYDRRPLVGITEAQVVACVPVYANLARAVKAEAILCFAWGRAGGASSFPSLRPSLMSLAAAVTRMPELEDDVINAPGVTVLDWHPIDADKTGTLVKFQDRNNPQFGTVTVSLDQGYVRVEIVNAVDRDQSSKKDRKVI